MDEEERVELLFQALADSRMERRRLNAECNRYMEANAACQVRLEDERERAREAKGEDGVGLKARKAMQEFRSLQPQLDELLRQVTLHLTDQSVSVVQDLRAQLSDLAKRDVVE